MEIKCEYIEWSQYTCNITSATITEPNQEIKAFIGKHEAGKTDRDVGAIWFQTNKVHFMPRGIGKIFPNLKAVRIVNCRLKEITREVLNGLENIEELDLEINELTMVPDDLLEGMKKLRSINFSKNKLEFVSSRLLQPVLRNQMTYVSFWNNPTINAVFDASEVNPSGDSVDLLSLMKLIDEKCKQPPKVEKQMELLTSTEAFKEKFMQGFEDLFATGHLADFTIVVYDRKFPVHKNVLAIQSEFFAETFKNEDGNFMAELKIEDLSVEAVEEVLKWIYTGKTPGVKNATEVLALTMKLKISGLKEIAENLILLKLNQDNAIEVFELGHGYKSEKLKDLAFVEIRKFLHELNLDENLKKEPEKLKKIFEIKKNYNEDLKKALEN